MLSQSQVSRVTVTVPCPGSGSPCSSHDIPRCEMDKSGSLVTENRKLRSIVSPYRFSIDCKGVLRKSVAIDSTAARGRCVKASRRLYQDVADDGLLYSCTKTVLRSFHGSGEIPRLSSCAE
jgi:hypothetical protein